MKSIIVGMGIGQLYYDVLVKLGHEVVTVDSDPNKNAAYTSVDAAITAHEHFDTAHICTPNFTHEAVARQLAANTDIVFVEKPGFVSEYQWRDFHEQFPNVRVIMVKNNQWRDTLATMQNLAKRSSKIDINWINHDRVPRPGSWFTNQFLAWGGVSRDLLPHLLSIFIALDSSYIKRARIVTWTAHQRWRLEDITSSDYGTVDAAGVYNVDDVAALMYKVDNLIVNVRTEWRSMKGDDIAIHFYIDGEKHTVPLGLCPEEAYESMIKDCIANRDNAEFWQNHYEQDLWIHQQIQI